MNPIRINSGPAPAPTLPGLSHRAYVQALRSPGNDTAAHVRLDQPGRGSMIGSIMRLVSRLGRRT